MTNTSGSVVWKTDYKPFGEEQSITGTIENNEKFAGKEKDKETGLYYFGARYLGPKIGRFITVDPAGIKEKDLLNPQKLNRYSYSLNNPYRYVDPDGKWPEDVHNTILTRAFSSGKYKLSENVIRTFMQASVHVDEFQEPAYSYMHAMRAPNQQAEAAERQMNNFIRYKVKEYKRLMSEGKKGEAYFALGEAMHPLMDSTSPAHEGLQEWEGLNGPAKLGKGGLHLLQEREGEFNSDPGYSGRSVELLRKFYDENH